MTDNKYFVTCSVENCLCEVISRKKDDEFEHLTYHDIVNRLNELNDDNIKLKKVIDENEEMIQSIYEELTKLRQIKENLRRIKSQWDWIMEAIQYE